MSARATYWLALSLGLIGFGLLAWHFRFVCDDAFITFRYSRHLAEGRGLVFNPADVPPVEGYSNLAWTLLLAGCYSLGATGFELGHVANGISATCGAALLALVVRVSQRRFGTGRLATVLTAVFTGTFVPLTLWSTSGLETMPFALALFAVFERLEGERGRPRAVQAGLAAVCAALLRADGFLWLGVVLGLIGLGALLRSGGRDLRMFRALLITGVFAAVAVGGQFLWRHGYYGEWMPNTAKVKTGFSALRLERGLKYLGSLALAVPALVLVPLLSPLARRPRAERDGQALGAGDALDSGDGLGAPGATGLAWRCAGALAVGCAYSIYVGGDFMPMGRFLVPTLPFLALLFAAVLGGLERRGAVPALTAGVPLITLGLLTGLDVVKAPDAWMQAMHFRWNSESARTEYAQWELQKGQAERWSWLARALNVYTQPGESIVRGPVGAVGYLTELEVLDLNGLVTLSVAEREAEPQRVSPGHDKHVDVDFFYPVRPTYLSAGLIPVGMEPSFTPDIQASLQSGNAVYERHRLRPKQGFPPGLDVFLLRGRWD